MSAHKRFCAHCRKPGGQLTANWWFPPLRLGQRRPVRVDPPCCFNPVGCGCLSAANTVGWLQAQNTVLLESRDLLRAELASARAELKRVREHQEIRARVIREKNAKLREVEHLLGIDAIYPPRDVADAVRELLAGLEQLRAVRSWLVARDGGRDCLFCGTEIRRGEAYELVPDQGLDALRHIHCPTSKETTMPATNDGGPIADPMITAAAEAIEEAMVPRIGRDLGTIHRDPIVAACVAAALRVMADEAEVESSFPMTADLVAEMIRNRADGLTDVPDRGAR